VLPRVSWSYLAPSRKEAALLGFIGYKVGMKSAYVKDDTANSMTKGKRIIIPVTIIECPPMKILSVRAYKNGIVAREVIHENADKELMSKVKLPKKAKTTVENFLNELEGKSGEYSDVKIIAYSVVKKTGIKKTPDIIELGLSGTVQEKIAFIKNNISKDLHVKDFITSEFSKEGLVDIRGVTKGKGFQGSTKRFGLDLLPHKTEKGIRGPGSGGPWHPARVEFRQPMAGQMGFFTRVHYNHKIVFLGNQEKNINQKSGFKNFGVVKNDYVIVEGSVQGSVKRPLLITAPLRATKKQLRKNYTFVELR
jgi:large subunit ribosomal protein L3